MSDLVKVRSDTRAVSGIKLLIFTSWMQMVRLLPHLSAESLIVPSSDFSWSALTGGLGITASVGSYIGSRQCCQRLTIHAGDMSPIFEVKTGLWPDDLGPYSRGGRSKVKTQVVPTDQSITGPGHPSPPLPEAEHSLFQVHGQPAVICCCSTPSLHSPTHRLPGSYYW